MNGETSDPELTDDLVGVASARLTAAGVPRGERLRALRLLSILSTLADTDLRVRRPLAMVASEFDLPADEVDIWLDDLVAVGVVRLDGTSIVVGGREPARDVRMTLHDFLDAAAELDAAEAAPPRRRMATALLRPSSAVLAAAAVIAVALMGPAVLDRPSTPVSTSNEVVADSPVVATTAGPGPELETPPTTEAADDERATTGAASTAAPTSTTLLPCPVGEPILEVTGATVDALGRLAIDGVARNPSGESLTVESFTLRTSVDGQEITAPGTQRELVVPAHATVLWQATIPVIAPVGTLVRATLGDWDWESAEARRTCPSP